MSEKDTGGPAFPVIPPDTHSYREWPAESGMTLRDYFAAQSIMLAYSEAMRTNEENWTYAELAEAAYDMADAMLKARAE
jgi:tryptophan 2,3-dioxygenase